MLRVLTLGHYPPRAPAKYNVDLVALLPTAVLFIALLAVYGLNGRSARHAFTWGIVIALATMCRGRRQVVAPEIAATLMHSTQFG